MKLPHLIPLALVFLISACSSGGGGKDESDPGDAGGVCENLGLTRKVVGGVECGALEHSPIVRVGGILRTSGFSIDTNFCSGALITDRQVLTAAHCFSSIQDAGGRIAQVYIELGDADSRRRVVASGFALHPSYRESFPRDLNDVAIVTLTESISGPVLPILTSRAPQVEEIGAVYGFGQTAVGESGSVPPSERDFRELIAGEMKITSVSVDHVFVTYPGSGANVCFGDSGGPLVLTVEGTPASVGVVSGGTRTDCGPGDITHYTNLQKGEVLDFIRAQAPGATFR